MTQELQPCIQKPLWRASESLSERVQRLRTEFFSFESRDFRNEVLPLTTGRPWDVVYAIHTWTNVPEVLPFLPAFEDSLAAAARLVALPEGFGNKALIKRRALFFAEVLRTQLPVRILEGELIVGAHFNVAQSLCLTKAETRRRHRREEKFRKGVNQASNLGIGNCGAVSGHLIPDYPRVLREGFRGIDAVIQSAQEEESNTQKRAVLEAFSISIAAVRDLAQRYAQEAESLAHNATPDRAVELRKIARICRKVPWEAAETFQEALQSLWLTHMLVLTSESYPGAGVSFGRFDQYLFPYYQADLEAGRLTREEAAELLRCFWIKPNYAYDYQGRLGRNQGINSSFGQLVTLSGCGPEGEDRSNELTYLCLDVIEEMNLLEPKPNVRLHANSPERLIKRVCEILSHAQGAPFLLNFDENAMRGLQWQGLPKEDLWDYACVGCLENSRQGDDRSGTVDVNLNLAKAIEFTLFQGRDQAEDRQIGPKTPNPLGMQDWADFEAAFRKQLSFCLRHLIELNNQADTIRARYEPTPYLSTLVGGCIENRCDITAGGARHNSITVEGVALAIAADSLLAVKDLVFEKKRISMARLIEALEMNFEGEEFLRQLLLNKPPKYGNDSEEADSMARAVTAWWAKECRQLETPETKKQYRAGYLSWNYGITWAPLVAATPDGRPRGAWLSNGVAAVTGMDRHGPTAAARSVGNLDLSVVPSGASHTISLSPSLVRDEEHLEKLAAFLRGYCQDGGSALQINLIDAEELRKAQAQPDEYRNLLVRVTGYNAYFTNLGREIQNEIIAREAHQ